MLSLDVQCDGKTTEDILEALDEVRRLVEEGYTSGGDRNDSGRYNFSVDGEEERIDE